MRRVTSTALPFPELAIPVWQAPHDFRLPRKYLYHLCAPFGTATSALNVLEDAS